MSCREYYTATCVRTESAIGRITSKYTRAHRRNTRFPASEVTRGKWKDAQ